MKMIFIFIDGLGIGEIDPEKNPIFAAKTTVVQEVLLGAYTSPVDASMTIEGLPQSATGQTSIFTGVNASKVLGRHLSGQPTTTLKRIINTNNLFKELLKRGYSVTNANVYRDEYLHKMLDPKDKKHRPSVTSVMTFSAGIKFRTIEDFNNGDGVYHDITGKIIKDSGYDTQIITPEEAAKRLFNISRKYDFTLYEHFMTDIIGHSMDMELATDEILLLDRFLGKLFELCDLKEDTIFIVSDHGNIEDMSVKTHTMNKVPAFIRGKMRTMGIDFELNSILDVCPSILKAFDNDRKSNAE